VEEAGKLLVGRALRADGCWFSWAEGWGSCLGFRKRPRRLLVVGWSHVIGESGIICQKNLVFYNFGGTFAHSKNDLNISCV